MASSSIPTWQVGAWTHVEYMFHEALVIVNLSQFHSSKGITKPLILFDGDRQQAMLSSVAAASKICNSLSQAVSWNRLT